MKYKDINEYGVIGNLLDALVGSDGSIDWFCLPRFDGPSDFARILDTEKGGYFQITTRAGGRRCLGYRSRRGPASTSGKARPLDVPPPCGARGDSA